MARWRAVGILAVAAALGAVAPASAQGPGAAARAGVAESGLAYVLPLPPEARMRVQDRLRELGFHDGRVDGAWDAESQAALERFQHARGLRVTGQLSPAVAAVLGLRPTELLPSGFAEAGSAAAGGDAGPVGMASGPAEADPALARAAQARLRTLGLYRDAVDGIWGPASQAALRLFQQQRALAATGGLDEATRRALALDPDRAR